MCNVLTPSICFARIVYRSGKLIAEAISYSNDSDCGRFKSDYRYSNNLVYNNFPFPEAVTEKQQVKVEENAQAVLSARELFHGSTLADLYDSLSMPKELLKAHRELDAVVNACYRRAAFKSELERLEYLFELYARYAEPLAHAMAQKPKRTRRGA